MTESDCNVNENNYNPVSPEHYTTPVGPRSNDLRIAIRSLHTARLLLNKPATNYTAAELHQCSKTIDDVVEILEAEMIDSLSDLDREGKLHAIQRRQVNS